MMQPSLSQPLRGQLVRTAETVLDRQGSLPRNPENSQLARLVQVAGEAACADEIANYLRYQGARGRWKRSLAEDVIEAIDPLLGSLESEPHRLAAWRLYATYLRRAYFYRREVNRDLERSRRRETPQRPAAAQQGRAAPGGGEAAAREEGAHGEGAGKRRRQRRRGRRPGSTAEGAPAEALAGEAALDPAAVAEDSGGFEAAVDADTPSFADTSFADPQSWEEQEAHAGGDASRGTLAADAPDEPLGDEAPGEPER